MLCRSLSRTFATVSQSYAILGLKSSAKLTQIKSKYYGLAKEYHPDVNTTDANAQKKFADITHAYKLLVNSVAVPEEQSPKTGWSSKSSSKSSFSREAKDSRMKNDKRQKTAAEFDTYEDFYDYDVYFKGGKKHRKPKIGGDIYINTTITLKQSIMGFMQPITFTKNQPCKQCASKQFISCFPCGGKGEIYDRMNREKVVCEVCEGKGYENNCPTCYGSNSVPRDVKESIYIEKGTQDKTILKIENGGHCGYKHSNGDLYVTVFVEKSDYFRIDGNNVHTELDLDYITAVVGGTVTIETIYGHHDLKIESGTQSGTEIRVFNLGLKSQFSKRLGDHIVKIKIKIPEQLSERQKKLLSQLDQAES